MPDRPQIFTATIFVATIRKKLADLATAAAPPGQLCVADGGNLSIAEILCPARQVNQGEGQDLLRPVCGQGGVTPEGSVKDRPPSQDKPSCDGNDSPLCGMR